MNKKQVESRFKEVTRSGMKKVVMSEEFAEMLQLSQMLPGNLMLKLILFILGFIFLPRILLTYITYKSIKFMVKLAMFIAEVEKEENISIIG